MSSDLGELEGTHGPPLKRSWALIVMCLFYYYTQRIASTSFEAVLVCKVVSASHYSFIFLSHRPKSMNSLPNRLGHVSLEDDIVE